METTNAREESGLVSLKPRWRIVGMAAPVFPGFEVDILDRVPDDEKPEAVWHRDRARAILRAHPEVKDLFGTCAWTAIFCVLAAGLQFGLAVAGAYMPWWGVVATAYIVGSSVNIMLFQLSHECDHCLIFKKASWNRYLFTLTSLPMFLSGHHTWWVEHIVHHNDMGATKDFITRRRTIFLSTRDLPPMFVPFAFLMLIAQVGRSLLGLVLYVFTSLLRGRLRPTRFTLTVLTDEHLVSGYEKQKLELWAVVYPLVNLSMCGALLWFFGVKAIAYLLLSQLFMTGFLQPYCLGWVLGISHFHGTRRYQPTASYYGRLINLLTFNAGLHVEHHDLMGIPWCRLWKLRRVAHEFYDDLDTIQSYTLLGLKFVFSSRASFEKEFNNETRRNVVRFEHLTDRETEQVAEVDGSG